MEDLDAILGIEPEEEETKAKAESPSQLSSATQQEIKSLAEEVSKIIEEESGRPEIGKEKEFVDKMTDIVRSATDNAEGKADAKTLLSSLEKLLQSVTVEKSGVSDDIKTMKDQVFSADTFWVTEVFQPVDAYGGHRFRGNIRGPSPEASFEKIESKLKQLFGDKYEVLMFEEPLTPDQFAEQDPKPKICFQIVPSEIAGPPKSPSWRPVATGVLFLFTLATSYVLGVSSNIGNIPKPVVEYMSRPENFGADEWPEFLKSWDPTPFLLSAATVALGVILLQLAHEAGHRVMARLKGIKLKGSLLIPNTQIGTFGSVTQLDSLVRNKQDLWDLAFSGVAAGGIASLVVFIAGLVMTTDPSVQKESLIPVQSILLQGSTLIGGILELALGPAANQRLVYLHPLVIAGWCGLTTTALNCLPVGNLDGGRMMLSAYGRQPLNISSIFSYIGLALGLLGSALALPFGLYVLICDRDPEIYIRNQVTEAEQTRKWITAVCIGIAVLILLPMGMMDGPDPVLDQMGPLI